MNTDREVCSLPKETGPCKAAFQRYYYDNVEQKCLKFIYGGCRGNENNFETIAECEQTCKWSQCPTGESFRLKYCK